MEVFLRLTSWRISALSKILKKIGPPLCLWQRVVTSSRRWEKNGIIRTVLLMWYLRLAYFLGDDPKHLASPLQKIEAVMNTADCRLIVFAKAPVPGQVKTRLIPSLGPSAAAALYEQLVLHCLSIAIDARCGSCRPLVHPFLEPSFLSSNALRKFQIILLQSDEGDLGSRMAHAFHETLKKSFSCHLNWNRLPISYGLRSPEKLQVFYGRGIDAVIGPAEDGGYVLIGLSPDTLLSYLPASPGGRDLSSIRPGYGYGN